jgi:ribonucleotide monophosphatase NagD (HAD superfamily)
MVGDNVETDIPAGIKAGVRTALILTGISKRSDLENIDGKPAWIVESFAELADVISADRTRTV